MAKKPKVMWLLALICLGAQAETMTQLLTDTEGKYTGPSVQDQIKMMDTDKNGFADVFEIRAYLVKLHGADYQKELLDNWVASAQGKSCTTPFAKELYSDSGQISPH